MEKLEKEVEEARAQTAKLKREHDAERERIKKALADFKKKADR